MPAIECVYDGHARLGESPVWDAANRCLWWVDILAPAVFRIDLASRAVRSWPMPKAVSALALCGDGTLGVALANGVHIFDPETGSLKLLIDPEPERIYSRLNDGKVGPDGAFWIGSMDDRKDKEAIGTLYRVTRDGRAETKIEGLQITNGLAWSADGRTMFHADSRGPWIDRWDLDPATGAISGRTRIATLTNEEGRPDGGATDMEGAYWSCGVSAACLNRFDRDGKLLDRVPLPFPRPTMIAFGGEDMKTLFVTSISDGLAPEILAKAPQAGGLFALRVEVPGVPVGLFR
jgi:sugar lactone lactonase YvrE